MADDIIDALYRKATGFIHEEEIREYSSEDELIKRKVTTKQVPPDTAAVKAFLELSHSATKFQNMSVEELGKEAHKIYEDIKELTNGNKETE